MNKNDTVKQSKHAGILYGGIWGCKCGWISKETTYEYMSKRDLLKHFRDAGTQIPGIGNE